MPNEFGPDAGPPAAAPLFAGAALLDAEKLGQQARARLVRIVQMLTRLIARMSATRA